MRGRKKNHTLLAHINSVLYVSKSNLAKLGDIMLGKEGTLNQNSGGDANAQSKETERQLLFIHVSGMGF